MNLPKTAFFIFFCLLFASGILAVKVARAQIPPPHVDCDDTDSPEFHSLRPYQASPCGEPPVAKPKSDLALFCGNSLVVSDSVTLNRNQATACVNLPGGKVRCEFDISRSRNITIDLRDADLPIMGNTELAVNSQNQSEELDDAEKVNEYLSWYLNGVTGRAEYPHLRDDQEDLRKIIDFSGPLKKLLPWDGQIRARIETVERAKKDRHDQVVACTYGLPIRTSVGPFLITLGQMGGIPGPCYNNGIIDFFVNLFSLKEEHRLSDWNKEKRLPPLRDEFDDFTKYWVAYKRWRGESCAAVPIPFLGGKEIVLCYDNPAKPNFWSNLFAYIPFSSTEDRKGLVETSTYSAQPVSEDLKITSVSFSNQTPAELFFAHMEESAELAELLQQTFVPQGVEKVGPVTGVSPGASCDLVNVRSNEGDDLFAGQIGGTLSYTAKATCDFAPVSKPATTGGGLSGPAQECTKTVNVHLSVVSKTPKADEVWSRTVAGASAIFKRIFPKVGPGGAILGILDIPAATKVSYVGADFAGNPEGKRSGEGAELYFPHIGGIQEYFLKGIQTMLRPKGFGEQILSGQPAEGVGGQCEYTNSAIAAAISAAASKYSLPASLLRAIFEIEGLDYIANPGAYVCMENAASAAGLMQITKGTYNVVTCENERLDNDLGVCDAGGGKLSRCGVDDVFELAARTLLWKAGKWVYGPGNCRATGGISASNKQEIYDASCRYYGSYAPDNLTTNLSNSIPADKRRPGGAMNYCDIVCYKMGLCPPYP